MGDEIRSARQKDLYEAEMAAFGKTLNQAEIRKLPNKQLLVYNKKVLKKTRAAEKARHDAELARRIERRRAAAELAQHSGSLHVRQPPVSPPDPAAPGPAAPDPASGLAPDPAAPSAADQGDGGGGGGG